MKPSEPTLFHNLQPLILASESPRRLQLLQSLGLTFQVVASGVDERDDPGTEPGALVRWRAREKAEAVSRRHPRSWVLSADTIVVYRHTVLGKPADAEAAAAMLQKLSGREHRVFSGLCLRRREPTFLRLESFATEVRFKPLSAAEIAAYILTGEPFDKAGAYGIQGTGAFLVESIHGSYTNVVGLPLCEALEWLLEQGVVEPVVGESDKG
jgi:septum formation protein